jgi:hypothetical protein
VRVKWSNQGRNRKCKKQLPHVAFSSNREGIELIELNRSILPVAGCGLERASFASPRTWPSVRAVSFDHTNQQVEKNLSLGGIERRQYAIIGSFGFDVQSSPERFSLRREIEITYSPVRIIGLSLDEALRMKAINNKARITRIDSHSVSETALVDSRLNFKRNERAVLQLYEILPCKGFRNHAGANLLKASGQGSRAARQGRSSTGGFDRHPG